MTDSIETRENTYFHKLVELFADTLDSTVFVIQRQTEGVTHAESLMQLPFRGNCMNWVLGHILSSRGRMLALLDDEAAPPLTEAENALYMSGSDPLTADSPAVPFARLLELLAATTAQLQAAIRAASADFLSAIIETKRQNTRLDALLGLMWHETYHIGQFEILRQAVGKNDKIF